MCSRCREAATALIALLALSGCEREARRFTEPTPMPESPYEYNAFAMNEGKRLYEWFNCNGCHASGGGAIGPALMDDNWVYGAEPHRIYQTIVEGRPNGMPAFGRRIPEQQVWQLVAYVRSMSGLVSKDAAPSRSDHISTSPSEQSAPEGQPQNSSLPASSTR